MATKWQRTRVAIPDDLSPSQREQVAFEILEHIIERTQQGTGFRQTTGREFNFPAYTSEYAKRKGQSNVDLVASFDMLEEMDLLSHRKGSLLIGFENGSTENAKADGNSRGTYGRSRPIPGKAMPFLGLRVGVLSQNVRGVRGS